MLEQEHYFDLNDDGSAGDWQWFNAAPVTITTDTVSPELVTLLSGDALEDTTRPVKITAPTDEGTKTDFILYRVKFQPIKFNYWNTWYKRLYRRVFGTRRAIKRFYKDALVLSYSGKALASESKPGETIGRLV